jgi:hypothetical protein
MQNVPIPGTGRIGAPLPGLLAECGDYAVHVPDVLANGCGLAGHPRLAKRKH